MRDWSLGSGDPLHLTLAADARLCKPDYGDDQIWEVELGAADAERSAVSLNTTYGLRARAMRVFLRFTEGNTVVTDPNTFATKPSLRHFYPNFLTLEFAPFDNLSVSVDFWIPESHALAGRITLTNKTNAVRQLKFELCASLAPLDGQSVVPTQQQKVNILAGQTSGVAPVIFMSGGPKHGPGPYPSLLLDLELGPGAARTVAFAEAALEDITEAFDLARKTAARSWEAERTRIEMTDTSQVLDIRTGDLEWDAALAFSQKAAHALFFNGGEHLPNPSFVQARHMDHGFSYKGDGSDYAPVWNGQPPLETYYISSILQGSPQVPKNLILNFLATQSDGGEVDNRPGLGGQRGKLLAAPLLATLAWNYFQNTNDADFISEVYPKLVKFFWAWFTPAHDRNRDGIPEWDHILQTGFDDNPIFDVWHPWSQGLDISLVHSPSLESMLYREAQSLAGIAKQLGKPAEESALVLSQAEKIRDSINAGWNVNANFYSYRDRETGMLTTGKTLASKKGDGNMRPKFESEKPVRLLIEIQTKNPAARRPEVEISEYFSKNKGEVEVIPGHQFQWRTGGLVATSQKTYSRVGRISVRGLETRDKINVKVVDTTAEDVTLAMPLWAQVPGQQQVRDLIDHNLRNPDRFDRPFGLPSLTASPDPEADSVSMSVYFPWNQLIGEGLLAYGFRAEAARLVTHMMKAVIHSLKRNHSFYQRYHAEKGSGIGERNALHGFAPVGLFMQALGVTMLSSNRVRLEGRNPFPWPVTIKFKGLTVVRGTDQTTVTFMNGESAIVRDEQACIVEM